MDNKSTLVSLKDTIMNGWPREKASPQPGVALYYHFHDELTIMDGIILRGDHVEIPTAQWKTILEKLHTLHVGVNGYL